jgi:hypothetical protein
MSKPKKTDLDLWLFRFFKAGTFLSGIATIYHFMDRELRINEFAAGFIDLRIPKFGGLAVAFLFALYLLTGKGNE